VYNTIYHVGSIIATWTTFGTFAIQNNWSWRIPSILQALPSVFQFTLLWLVPKYPRWLISKDRDEEALNVLAKYHSNGDRTDPTVQFEFQEISGTIHLETQFKKESSYLDFFKTKGNRYRFVLFASAGLFSQWSGNGLTSYYFTLVMDSVGITSKHE
jgi:MFS family permease